MRVFDENGNEVKPTTLEVSRSGRIEAWQLPQGKAIIATIDPFHYEDGGDAFDAYRVKLYCLNGSMRLVGVVFVSNPLDDIANYVRDVLAGCQQSN
jgi:hypothetical protein